MVDDHSSDNTYETALAQQKTWPHLQVIRTPRNMGYGGSQKIAYQKAIDDGLNAVVMLHADAQYAPEYLPNILNPVTQNQADMVFGSRIAGAPLKGGMPLYRFVANKSLTYVQNKCLGTSLSEFHSGYRAYNLHTLQHIPFHRFSDGFHFDTEIIIAHIHQGLRICETPIPTYYGAEKNYVPLVHYGVQVLASSVSYRFYKADWPGTTRWHRILEAE